MNTTEVSFDLNDDYFGDVFETRHLRITYELHDGVEPSFYDPGEPQSVEILQVDIRQHNAWVRVTDDKTLDWAKRYVDNVTDDLFVDRAAAVAEARADLERERV